MKQGGKNNCSPIHVKPSQPHISISHNFTLNRFVCPTYKLKIEGKITIKQLCLIQVN